MAIFGTQLAEATSSVIGTFRQQDGKFVPCTYVRSEMIDFGQTYDESAHTHLKFAYDSNISRTETEVDHTASGFYETTSKTTAGTATLTALGQIKLVVEPSKFTWTQQTTLLPSSIHWRAATYHKEKTWVIATVGGQVAISINDGVAFSLASAPSDGKKTLSQISNNWFGSLCGGHLDQILAISTDGKIAVSQDGIGWEYKGSISLGGFVKTLAYAKDRYVIITTTGILATSSNGLAWTSHGDAFSSITSGLWYDCAYDGKKFIAANDNGNIAVSSNGLVWTSGEESLASIESKNWRQMRYGETCGIFVAIQSTENCHTAISRDGLKWIDQGTELKSFNSAWDGYMTYGNGKFLAVSNGNVTAVGSYQGTISFDGTSYEVSRQRTFFVTPTSGSIALNMENIRLVTAELLGGSSGGLKVPNIAFDTSFQSEVNRPKNKVVAAVGESDGAGLLASDAKIIFPEESAILADFICNSTSLDGNKTPLDVQANLSPQCETILSGDWREYKNGSFETTNAGTLRIETAASLPQSNITIRDGAALQFASGLEVTTAPGSVLDLRGCSSVSGGKSLTLGAGARIIF